MTNRDALADVRAERMRQMHVEGWTPEHDDSHSCGELSDAAACYASPAPHGVRPQSVEPPKLWPWAREWWKPKDRRSNLVRAAALIVAEIERLDRKSGQGKATAMPKQEMTVYDCPQCGEQTFSLHEGYCKSCCEKNQSALDAHNAQFDRWERLTDAQREAEIKAALRRS